MSFKKKNTNVTGTGNLAGFVLLCLAFFIPSPQNFSDMDLVFSGKLTISAINCNSLNSSVASRNNRNLKVHGITKLATDIIFLSDIRLSNRSGISQSEEFKKHFQLNMYDGYDCFFNSSMNKRGVAVLINKKISYSVLDQIADPEENYLILKTTFDGEQIGLCSIYGPNTLCENFFESLKNNLMLISGNNSVPIVVGGDWNCMPSVDPVPVNIDIFNMQELPNRRHSELLLELCAYMNLCEPYRVLNFNSKDYSYVPRCDAKSNWSRIDFFLVSENLIKNISRCEIADTLQSKLFSTLTTRKRKRW
jgi:exonuclease III